GARIDVTPVRFRGVRVEVEVITPPLGDPVRIREDVEDALYRYLNPLVGGVVDREGTGWPFGRHLNVGEVFGVVNLVQGVERVSALEVFHYDLQTGKKLGKAQPESIQVGPDELIASGRHSVTTKVREVGA
ncbi:MAG: putative baseplate assembly protein, partial [Solirubrobacterales bacterium]|nr:putative baseplate assembly protein [Solirubrobacterales bacterium]